MNTFVLALHNIVRWLVIILGVLAAVKAIIGWLGKRPWTKLDDQLGLFFTIAMDIQLLLGLLLYFVFSDIVKSAFNNFAAAMADSGMRFFAVEHIFIMVIAVVLAHIGRVFSRRQEDPVKKHQWAAIFFTLSILAVLFATPWSRPLLPF